jgi:hypothetical protein
MSRPMKAVLTALLLIAASAVFLLAGNRNTTRSARAAEPPASTRVQVAGNATQEQLHQLLLERKQLLEKIVDDMKIYVEAGRVSGSAYAKTKEAALLAGLDLCNTKAERIEIRRDIVELYKEVQDLTKRRTDTGRASQSELDEARLARLEAEINLLKEQL